MELTVLQDDLAKAVSIASRFVSPKHSLPVLSHILLQTKKGELRIAATNLEVGISLGIGANIKTAGETTLVAKTLSEIISSLPRGKLELKQNDGLINLRMGGYSVNLSTTPANDLPKIPSEIEGGMVFPQEIFKRVAQKVVFATSTTDARPEYSSVLFLEKEKGMEVVATDGVRLSKISLKEGMGEVEKVFVPAGVLSEVPKIFQEKELKVEVAREKSQILFGTDDRVLTAQMANVEFPDFEKIIPTSFESRITVDKEELLGSLQIASVVSQDQKVEFSAAPGFLSLSSENPQIGSQTSKIEAKVEGEEILIAFNWRFVREFLGAVEGDEIVIELASPISPGVFKDPKDHDFLHLIMPIRRQI